MASASLARAKMRYSYLEAGERGATPAGSPDRRPTSRGAATKCKDPMMASQATPETVGERVDAHYAAALQAVRLAARDYQAHTAKIGAHGTERGVWQVQRDLAARDWDRALGATAALEELADVLGVALTDDRRRRLPLQRR